jgi:prepilin-type processing-associated H-X9-DG protein
MTTLENETSQIPAMRVSRHHSAKRAAHPGSGTSGCEARWLRRPIRQRQGSFTRIELVVAVMVAGLLGCLVLPVFPYLKTNARLSGCGNNLRRLATGFEAFANEFRQYPNGSEWSALAPTGAISRLRSHLPDDRRTLVCPERIVELESTPADTTPFSFFSYGYNDSGSAQWSDGLELGMGRLRHIAISEIKAPSQMITLGDTGLGALAEPRLNPHDTVRPEKYPWPQHLPSERHRGGANILFCDGHVTYGKRAKWIEKNDQARRQWNNDHEPHPETW